VTASGAEAFIWSTKDHKKPLAVLRQPAGGKSNLNCARFSPDGKWLVTASADGKVRIWSTATYLPAGQVIDRHASVLCVRFSPDGTLLAVTGEDAQAAVYDTRTWKQTGQPIIAPGPVFSAFITPDNRFLGLCAYLNNAVQFFEIKTGSPLGEGLPIPAQPTCVDFLAKDKVVVVACDDGTVRAIDSPFVDEQVPAWICDFAECIAGCKKTGDDTFEPVDSNFGQLMAFLTPEVGSSRLDFERLTAWRMRADDQRPGMPRFTSTLAANIERRVDERSLQDLFECYDTLPGDPLVLAALSLYWPNARHGEYLADLVLNSPDAPPLARCFAAETLINAGRSGEARVVMDKAVSEAPNDVPVLRRAAKFAARMLDEAQSTDLFERALRIDPNNYETRRSYAWALYNFQRPELAAAQFHLAQDIVGEMNDDLIAGLCLCAEMQQNKTEARADFTRLVALEPDWQKASYIASLRGWTGMEQIELEAVRHEIYGSQ
jgi:hypothetical protein